MALHLRSAGWETFHPARLLWRRPGARILLAAGSIAFAAGFTLVLSSLAPMFAPRTDSATVVTPDVTTPAATSNPFTVVAPTPSIPGLQPQTVAAQPASPVDGASFELRIPVLGYSTMVHQGVSLSALARGPGHYPSTPWPGQHGNVGVAGHNTPWLSFSRLKAGDRVEIRTEHGLYVYEITGSKVVNPSDRSGLAPTQNDRLTLTTCYPLWAGAYATQRLIFFAREIGGVG